MASWPSASGPPTTRQELPESAVNPNLQGLHPSLNRSTCTLPTLNFDNEKEVVVGSRQDEDKEVVQDIQQYDGKEVMKEIAQEKLESRRLVLNSTDNTGLYHLLEDEVEAFSYSSLLTHTESFASRGNSALRVSKATTNSYSQMQF